MFNFKICLNYFFFIKKSLFLKKNKKINHYLYDLKNLYINFFLNKILFSNIKIFFTKLFKSKVFFFNINLIKDFLLTAQLIFKFIARQLKRNRTLMKVIYTLFNEIKKQSNLLGFKILTCGRFTRRERALFKVWIHKKLAFSNITVPLDYYAGNFKSKFGLCSVRIWLFHKFY
jgi:ribosomal protein S3